MPERSGIGFVGSWRILGWGYPLTDAGVQPDSVVPQLVRASERAIEADSGSALAWLARADALRFVDPTSRRGMLDAVRRSLQIDSTSADAWSLLGDIWRDSLQLRPAIAAYQRAVALNPGHVTALAFLGFSYMWLGDNDSALVWADSATAVDHSDIVARQSLSIVRRARREWDMAEPEYQAVVRLGTGADQIHGWAGLAELAYRRRDRRATDTLLAHAIAVGDTLHPTLHEVAYLAWAYTATGQRDRAIRLLERFSPKYDSHFQLHLRHDPPLQELRNDPRYVALLRNP